MKPCKHLDYEDNKYGPDIILRTCEPDYPNVKYWERGETWTNGGENPKNVQFCKLRGRINSIFDCYECPGPMSCYEPKEEKG